jgi:hypothetical protein
MRLGLLGLSVLVVACGDDPRPLPGPDVLVPVPDTLTADTADTLAGPDLVTPPPGAPTFSYAGAVGSDGQPCLTQCALRRLAGESIALAVIYRDPDGNPVEGRRVSWALDAPPDLATLSAFSSNTDSAGQASVTLRSGGLTGSLTVTASVPGEPLSLTFTVTYETPPSPDLVTSFEYLGQLPLAAFELRLFQQREGTSCASVHPDAPPIRPDLVLGPFERGVQARVDTLPGLAAAGQQRWVIQYVGPESSEGLPLAVGCVDGVEARAGQTASALVYVTDLPRHFRGTFTTTTRLDTLSGGEGTAIGDVMLTLSEILTAPGTLLVTWACRNPSGTLATVCGWVTDSSGAPNVLGGVIVDAADQALLALFEQAVGADAQDATELIAEMLRDLRLVARTTFTDEPSSPRADFPGAFFAPGAASETWTHVRFRWRLDPNCKNSPNPADCGWSQIPLEDVYGFDPTAPLEAGIDQGLALHVMAHEVPDLTYGPLVNHLIERRILPLVFASGGDEPLDSWDDFVATLFGDRLCLDYDDCCEYFADRLEDSYVSYLVGWEGRVLACELAIPAVAQVLRDRLTRLDGALNLGTRPEAPCPSADVNGDRNVDGFGVVGPLCGWDLWFPVDGARFSPDNDWRSARQ